MDRRTLLASGLALAAAAPLRAQAPAPTKAAQRLPLWPKGVPGGKGLTVTDTFVKRSPDGPAAQLSWGRRYSSSNAVVPFPA